MNANQLAGNAFRYAQCTYFACSRRQSGPGRVEGAINEAARGCFDTRCESASRHTQRKYCVSSQTIRKNLCSCLHEFCPWLYGLLVGVPGETTMRVFKTAFAQSRRRFLAGTSAMATVTLLNSRASALFPIPRKADLDFIKANAPRILRATAPIAKLAFRAVPVVGQASLVLDLALVVSDVVELRQSPGVFRPQTGSAAAKTALKRLSILGVGASAVGASISAFERPRTYVASDELAKLIGVSGRLESALNGFEAIPGVIRGIIQEELEAKYRAELETKLEEFALITRLLEIEAAKLPPTEVADEDLPTKRRRRTHQKADTFSSFYLKEYVPAAEKLLPELAERLGNLKNYAAQGQRFAPATVSAVALGRTALAKLSGNLHEGENVRIARTRPADAWLNDAINPDHPNSVLSQIDILDSQIEQFLLEASKTGAGCATANSFGSQIPYRAVRVGFVGFRRYYYYFINYAPTASDGHAGADGPQYPVSAPAIGEIELSGYPSTDDRKKIEQEWIRQSKRYTGGHCGDRELIVGTNVRDPESMFAKLKSDPDTVDNPKIAEMLRDFRDWRALVFAADAGRVQRIILEQTAQIARAALGR